MGNFYNLEKTKKAKEKTTIETYNEGTLKKKRRLVIISNYVDNMYV